MSWAAGVLDARGIFAFRTKGEYPYTTVVKVSCAKDIGELLSEITGVGSWRKGTWKVGGREQEGFLGRMIPYLRAKHVEASKVYRWRLTAPRRRVGWEVSQAVEQYRESLVGPASKSGTQE